MDYGRTLQALEQYESYIGYYSTGLYELSTIIYHCWICVQFGRESSCFWHLVTKYFVQYVHNLIYESEANGYWTNTPVTGKPPRCTVQPILQVLMQSSKTRQR